MSELPNKMFIFVLDPKGPAVSLLKKKKKKKKYFESQARICSSHNSDFYTVFQLLLKSWEAKISQYSTTWFSHFSWLSSPNINSILQVEKKNLHFSFSLSLSLLQQQHFATVFHAVIEHNHKVGREL